MVCRCFGRKRQLAEQSEGLGSDEREELKRLREENRRLRMEREIFKKAATFFAKESR